MEELNELFVWAAESADARREIIPSILCADGEVQLLYSNNAPHEMGNECDRIAEEAAARFGKRMRLLRFNADGITVIRTLPGDSRGDMQEKKTGGE